MKTRFPILIGLALLLVTTFVFDVLVAWPETRNLIKITSETSEPTKHKSAITYSNGLLTVNAEEVRLKTLLEEISNKSAIEILISTELPDPEIKIHFDKLNIEEGLKSVLRAAGISDRAIVYKKTSREGKTEQWTIEKVYLPEKDIPKVLNDVLKTPISWPSIDDAGKKVAERLPKNVFSNISASPIPVFIPNLSEYPDKMRITTDKYWYSAYIPMNGDIISINGTNVSHSLPSGTPTYEHTKKQIGHRQVFITQTDGIWSITWEDFGAAYVLEVGCLKPFSDPKCTNDAYIRSLVESLVFVGGNPYKSISAPLP